MLSNEYCEYFYEKIVLKHLLNAIFMSIVSFYTLKVIIKLKLLK
jgi:hypothetical protein